MDVLTRVAGLVRSERALSRWAVASLVANIVIVVTGGVVRLTGSGLGCPTWPRCTPDSYVAHPALGIQGAIEFGNRLLTIVLVVVAILTFVAAALLREHGAARRDLRWLTAGMALGIPAQGVIGGVSVLTKLNPYVVALHLLASMILIALAVWLVRKTWGHAGVAGTRRQVVATRVTFVLMWAVVWLGTLVTGSGPHAGDEHAVRNGLDGALVSQIHAGIVYTTIAATVVCVWLIRSRAAWLLLAVEAVQASIGLAQYRLGLPVGLVGLHLLGAALAVAAATNLLLSVRTPRSSGTAVPEVVAASAV